MRLKVTGGSAFEKDSHSALVGKPQSTPGLSVPEQGRLPVAPGVTAAYGKVLQLVHFEVTTTQALLGISAFTCDERHARMLTT